MGRACGSPPRLISTPYNGGDAGVGARAVPEVLRRASDGQRGWFMSPTLTRLWSPTVPTSFTISAARSSGAEAGAAEGGLTSGRASRKATTAFSTRARGCPRTGDVRATGLVPPGAGRAILEAGHDAARSEGFQRLDLGATLPASRCIAPSGLLGSSDVVTMPDGVTLDAVTMERPSILLEQTANPRQICRAPHLRAQQSCPTQR